MIRRFKFCKTVCINASVAEDGRITTPDADPKHNYPYTELQKIGAGAFGQVFKAEKDGKFYIAKHQTLKNLH